MQLLNVFDFCLYVIVEKNGLSFGFGFQNFVFVIVGMSLCLWIMIFVDLRFRLVDLGFC